MSLIHSFPNICYLTGFEIRGPRQILFSTLAVPLEGDSVLLGQTFEAITPC